MKFHLRQADSLEQSHKHLTEEETKNAHVHVSTLAMKFPWTEKPTGYIHGL